jgi:transposase-like protein
VESLGEFYPEALWQRCAVHFYRNVWTAVPTSKVKEVAAMLKSDSCAGRSRSRTAESGTSRCEAERDETGGCRRAGVERNRRDAVLLCVPK